MKFKPLIGVPCERCGRPSEHRHHEDYSKPYEVVYLCRRCHCARHVELRIKPRLNIYASIRMPHTMIKDLRALAKSEKRHVGELVRLAIDEFIAAQEALNDNGTPA